ncbi:MAG: hypothetical protein ABEH42_09480 [Haloarculaceae archaeon]
MTRALCETALGLLLIGAATWILLAPLFGVRTPSLGLLGAGAGLFVLGFLLVGLGARASIIRESGDRPSVPDDKTMDWITRP